jgi:hypothetical protein
VFEDDVYLSENFSECLTAALDELPDDWDVLLLGALGAVHPSYYAVNLPHALMAGGLRVPRGARKAFGGLSLIHTPMRPFGTHAYAISERGAAKLLRHAPKANFHVDVIAWGMRGLKLFAVHPLLARQTHEDTTIGGKSDRSYLPNFIIDKYTGTDFAWAWNAPLLKFGQLRGHGGYLLTTGRSIATSTSGILLALALQRSHHPVAARLALLATLGWMVSMYFLITLLTWPQRYTLGALLSSLLWPERAPVPAAVEQPTPTATTPTHPDRA